MSEARRMRDEFIQAGVVPCCIDVVMPAWPEATDLKELSSPYVMRVIFAFRSQMGDLSQGSTLGSTVQIAHPAPAVLYAQLERKALSVVSDHQLGKLEVGIIFPIQRRKRGKYLLS